MYSDVSAKGFYYILSILSSASEDYSIHCTGIALNTKKGLGPASCVVETDPTRHHYSIVPKIQVKWENADYLLVKSVYIHPNFTSNREDFMVFEIDGFFPYYVHNYGSNVSAGCQLCGYGASKVSKDPPSDVPYCLSIETTAEEHVPYGCSPENGDACLLMDDVTPCEGDLGAPLICGGNLAGTLSRVLTRQGEHRKCGSTKGLWAIIPNIKTHKNWIKRTSLIIDIRVSSSNSLLPNIFIIFSAILTNIRLAEQY